MVKFSVILIFLALMLASCHDGCEPEDTKCDGDQVYVCYPDGDWDFVIDCGDLSWFPDGGEVEEVWICEEDEFGEAGCVSNGTNGGE